MVILPPELIFTDHLYKEKLSLLAGWPSFTTCAGHFLTNHVKAFPRSRLRRVKVFTRGKVVSPPGVILSRKRGDPTPRVTLLPEVSLKCAIYINAKWMQSWAAQASSGGRVTHLPGTTFIHVNNLLDCQETWRTSKRLTMSFDLCWAQDALKVHGFFILRTFINFYTARPSDWTQTLLLADYFIFYGKSTMCSGSAYINVN